MTTSACLCLGLLLATTAAAPAGAVSLGNGSSLAGNEVFDVGSEAGILDVDIYLRNNTRARIEVDVTGAEVAQGTIDLRALLANDTPGDLTTVTLGLAGGASWGPIGTLRDPVGDDITSYVATNSLVTITLDPPLPSDPNPQDPECCDFLEIGPSVEAGTDWEIEVSGLPAGGGSFFLDVQGVPEPGDGAHLTAIAALTGLSIRARSRRG